MTKDLPVSRKTMHSIGPNNKDFLEFIDKKIRNPIWFITQKNYLTISSCEGHSYFRLRYLVLAFTTLESRDELVKKVEHLKGKISWEELETCTYEVIEGVKYEHGTRENEIKGMNYIFGKNSNFYCFLRITIGKSVDSDKASLSNLSQQLKFSMNLYFGGIYNFFFREKITKELEKLFL